jgi:hypothetical protein
VFASEKGFLKMAKFGASALIVAGLIAIGFSAPAKANVVYDLTFESQNGKTVEGTGTLTLNFSTLAADESFNGTLVGILVSISTGDIDGNGSFSILPATLDTGSQFQTEPNGKIDTLTAEESGSGANTVLFLDVFSQSWELHEGNDDGHTSDKGKLVITGPDLVSATPLPATLPLFAGGLGFVGYLTRRKKRAQAVAAY